MMSFQVIWTATVYGGEIGSVSVKELVIANVRVTRLTHKSFFRSTRQVSEWLSGEGGHSSKGFGRESYYLLLVDETG